MATTLAEIRQQYPQYSDMSDRQLADGLYRRFYSDMPRADFDQRIGFQPQTWGDLAGDVATTVGRAAGRLNPLEQARQALAGYTGFERQLLQGATFSTADEIEAGARSLTGADYDTTVADIRRGNEAFARDNPVTALGANVAGGVVPFVAGPGLAAARWGVGATLPRTMGRSAVVGAGAGALSGFGAGEGDIAERLPSAASGAAMGAGFGAALPPVLAGAGRVISAAGRGASSAGRMLRGDRPSADYEMPTRPVGRPIEGATFTADGSGPPTPEAVGAQQGAMRLISDWITSAGGTIEGLEQAWAAAQRSGVFHGSGRALNAQTLAEIYPPLQRLLRSAASGYREVGEDVVRFLEARQTGILPRNASAADLAQRGIPTRERFMTGRTVQENLDQFGVQLGTGADNVSPTGQLGRLVDATKRLFRIKDFKFHGHAATAGRTSDDILAAMEREAAPLYTQAFAAGDMVSVRPTLDAIAQRWMAEAAQQGRDYRQMIARALNRFRDDSGNMVARLRAFDKAKQKLDDEIGELRTRGRAFEVRELTRLKNEMLEAVDGITQGNLGGLYSQARGTYASGARNRDILEDFKNAWKDDPEAVVARYDTLDADQQKLARYGIVWGMEAQNAGRRGAQDASSAFDVRRVEEMLTLLGRRMRAGEADAEDVMRRFGNYIAGEQEMVRGTTRTAIGGSMTDRNLQDALALGGMEIVQNVQSFANIWRGSTSLFEVGRALLEKVVDRAFGLSADRAREMSRLLLTANPQEITAIIAQLRMMMPANRMARFNELMQQARQSFGGPAAGVAGAAGGVAGAPSPIASGGPVSF